MTTMTCKWDRDQGAYIEANGQACGTPPRDHCTARKSCSIHLAWGELTCARCLGRVRADIRQIVDRAALMLPEALVAGVDSEAAMLAGPACDPEAWSWRKVAAKQGRSWHLSLVEDDDDWHPTTVLVRWAHMVTEDYAIDRPEVWTLVNAAQFLDRILGRVAQDEAQDFPLLRREIGKCRSHLEAVLRDSLAPERGVPCPICVQTGKVDPQKVRLGREYPHWCDDAECHQIHVDTDEADVWVCPRNREHWWSQHDYTRWVEERRGA